VRFVFFFWRQAPFLFYPLPGTKAMLLAGASHGLFLSVMMSIVLLWYFIFYCPSSAPRRIQCSSRSFLDLDVVGDFFLLGTGALRCLGGDALAFFVSYVLSKKTFPLDLGWGEIFLLLSHEMLCDFFFPFDRSRWHQLCYCCFLDPST